jgi:hypothetical protein
VLARHVRAAAGTLSGPWVVPGLAPVSHGLYRHPNVAVILEFLAAPMMFAAWRTALVFSALNAVALAVRIPVEGRARWRGGGAGRVFEILLLTAFRGRSAGVRRPPREFALHGAVVRVDSPQAEIDCESRRVVRPPPIHERGISPCDNECLRAPGSRSQWLVRIH